MHISLLYEKLKKRAEAIQGELEQPVQHSILGSKPAANSAVSKSPKLEIQSDQNLSFKCPDLWNNLVFSFKPTASIRLYMNE